jgi:FixJ family two-component response regulator
MTPIVHVVDDDPGFRNSLRLLLESDRLAVETYARAADFLARYVPDHPGCLLLDLRMPGMSGIQLQEELTARGIRVPTVFLTAHGDVPAAVTAVRRGALDFIEKPFDDEALIRLVRALLDRDAAAWTESERRRNFAARLASLSPRENEVLERVVDGKPSKIVADDLGISVKTVEFHRRRIAEKLQVATTAELIHLVVWNRLASGQP